MSDREENRKTNREPTEAPGGRDDAAEEYIGYGDVDPDQAEEREAEAVREAGLQPGGPERGSSGERKNEPETKRGG